MEIHIYGLIDPRDGQLRYIGATRNSLKARLSVHLSSAKGGGKSPRVRWLQGLMRDGLRPEIFTIEVVDGLQEAEAERFYIQYFSYLGCRLTNVHVPIVHPPIDLEKIDKSLPWEVLDLLVDRRGRPKGVKPCISCGKKGYAAPVIDGEKVPLCRRHYNTWYKRKQRAEEASWK